MEETRRRDWTIAGILAGASILRLGVAAWPVLSHPDELWQYLEPARHIVAGRWVETWDFRDGLRSWLLPMMLSGPMALGYVMAPSSRLDVLFARLLCVAISMLGVVAGIDMGRRLSRAHAIVVGIATASWFELVYLGPRTAAEPVATALALTAACLLSGRGSRRAALAGLLVGLSCAIRVQYAPALGILVLGVTGFDWRRWLVVGAGALGGLAMSAAADVGMGAVPFAWVWRNYSVNLAQGKAATFGMEPVWWYAAESWNLYGPGILAVVALALVGSRRYPALAWSAVANLIVHSLIVHKEYRFVFYTSYVVIFLAAIGSVDIYSRYISPSVLDGRKIGHRAILGLCWLAWSALSAVLGSAAATWGVNGRMIAAWKTAGDQSDVCGMAVYRMQDMPVASYALFSRNVPIYQYDDADRFAGMRSRAFNVVLMEKRFSGDFRKFDLVSCDRLNYFCVFRRSGSCVTNRTDRPHDENLFLIRKGR